MKNILKKFGLFFVVVSLVLGSFTISFGAGQEDTDLSKIYHKMSNLLVSVNSEKAAYNMDNLDLLHVGIGNKIPTYEVINNQFCVSELSVFPVILNSNILALFYVAETNDGDYYVQLSADFVEQLNTLLTENSNIALIYDNTNFYAYIDGTLSSLCYISENLNNRTSISQLSDSELSAINTAKVEVVTLFDSIYESQITPYAINATAYLPVDIYTQAANTEICWAICSASIVNYIFRDTGSSWTPQNINTMFNGGVDAGMNIASVVYNLNYYFQLQFGIGTASSNTETIVLNSLNGGYPIYAGFSRPNASIGHAVVIRGINTTSDTFSVMNPTPTTTGYTAGSYSGTTWQFISANTGYTYTLNKYAVQAM